MISERRAGAILSYISLGINAVTSFVYVPILIGALSQAEYGVYQLIGSIISYLSVMDMGLSTTLSRFYVRAKEREGGKATENLLAMAVFVYAALTVLALLACIFLNIGLDGILGAKFSNAELNLAHRMMLLVAVNCAVVLPGNWFLALINANERFIFARVLSCFKYVLTCACTILIVSSAPFAEIVLFVQVAFNLLQVVCYVIYCKRNLSIKVRLHQWDWRLAASLFSFSFFILLNMLFDQIFWKTGQCVLGAVVGASATAVYGVACQLITSGFMQVSGGVSGVFLPKLTAIAARTDDMGEINAIFTRIGRIQAMLVWGVFGAFAVLGEEFVNLWAGKGYEEVYGAALILMAGLSISLIQNLGVSILQAKNMQGFRSMVYIVIAIIDLAASIPISSIFGVIGCAATAAVMLLIGTGPVINWYYWRRVGIDIPAFFREVAPIAVPVIGAMLLTILGSVVLGSGCSWSHFVARCAVFTVCYATFLWTSCFNAYEKNLVLGIVNKLKRVFYSE